MNSFFLGLKRAVCCDVGSDVKQTNIFLYNIWSVRESEYERYSIAYLKNSGALID